MNKLQAINWISDATAHCHSYVPPGDHLNIKMLSYQYRDSYVKDKTISPTVLSLTWESPYLGKTVFILRRGPGLSVLSLDMDVLCCKFNGLMLNIWRELLLWNMRYDLQNDIALIYEIL